VKIIRSAKRKKTVQAKMVNSILLVYLPVGTIKGRREKWTKEMMGDFYSKTTLALSSSFGSILSMISLTSSSDNTP